MNNLYIWYSGLMGNSSCKKSVWCIMKNKWKMWNLWNWNIKQIWIMWKFWTLWKMWNFDHLIWFTFQWVIWHQQLFTPIIQNLTTQFNYSLFIVLPEKIGQDLITYYDISDLYKFILLVFSRTFTENSHQSDLSYGQKLSTAKGQVQTSKVIDRSSPLIRLKVK